MTHRLSCANAYPYPYPRLPWSLATMCGIPYSVRRISALYPLSDLSPASSELPLLQPPSSATRASAASAALMGRLIMGAR
jgi:hypothetical protein